MFKFDADDIPQTVDLDPLPIEQAEDYPMYARMHRKGITIDIHSDHLNLKRLPRRFTVYGFDPNYIVHDMYGDPSYKCIFEMPLSQRVVNGIKVYHPDYTQLDSEYQGMGLMPHIYKKVMQTFGIKMVSGDGQSPGSVKLWYKLAGLRGVEMHNYLPYYGWAPVKRNHKAREITTEYWDPYEYERSKCIAAVSA